MCTEMDHLRDLERSPATPADRKLVRVDQGAHGRTVARAAPRRDTRTGSTLLDRPVLSTRVHLESVSARNILGDSEVSVKRPRWVQ
jgi:hypothetical protein